MNLKTILFVSHEHEEVYDNQLRPLNQTMLFSVKKGYNKFTFYNKDAKYLRIPTKIKLILIKINH